MTSARAARLLLIDDDEVVSFAIADFLGLRGYHVDRAPSSQAARTAIGEAAYDLVVVDHGLPDGDGVALVRELRELGPQLGIVMVTGAASIDLAVRAMRDGADNFLTKPVELPSLTVLLERVLAEKRNARVAASSRARRTSVAQKPDVTLPAGLQVIAERAAAVTAPVLLLGETGTGKGVLARWLHEHGPAAHEALVELNCAGLSRDLVESELFGHERGAFTSADQAKPGLLELAHRGTLFLDEVAELDGVVQAKLLKVIEDQRFRRVGGTRDHQVAVRLIAATSRDVERMVAAGSFRRDLYYRLAGLVIDVPPLRARGAELPALAARLLEELAPQQPRHLTPAALEALRAHPWPGNVRELRNLLERACLFCPGATLDRDEIVPHLRRGPAFEPAGSDGGEGPPRPLADVERDHIEHTLRRANGRVELAAEWLGIPRSTLYQRLLRYGIGRR